MSTSQANADWSKPQPQSRMDQVFPARVSHLMPKYDDIPEDFRRERGESRKWHKMQSTWFFRGLDTDLIVPREGIDKNHALSHLAAIQGSFEPKHEHKSAAVAYLASLWFSDYLGE